MRFGGKNIDLRPKTIINEVKKSVTDPANSTINKNINPITAPTLAVKDALTPAGGLNPYGPTPKSRSLDPVLTAKIAAMPPAAPVLSPAQKAQQDVGNFIQMLQGQPTPTFDFVPMKAPSPIVDPTKIVGQVVDPSQFAPSQFAQDQRKLIDALNAFIATPEGQSAAQLMLKAEQDKAINQSMALAASMGGRALPVAQRGIMQQQALGNQEMIRQAAIIRAQESQDYKKNILNAYGLVGTTAGTARGQDQVRDEMIAKILQGNQATTLDADKTNAGLKLTKDLKDAEIAFETAMYNATTENDKIKARANYKLAIDTLTANALGGQASTVSGFESDYNKLAAAGAAQREADRRAGRLDPNAIAGGVVSGLASAGTSYMIGKGSGGSLTEPTETTSLIWNPATGQYEEQGLSDQRQKYDIANIKKKDINEFFSALKPKSYKYKDAAWGAGPKVGFMLQDIEKTKLGSMISRELPGGKKGYDKQGLEGIILAKFAMEQQKKKRGE